MLHIDDKPEGVLAGAHDEPVDVHDGAHARDRLLARLVARRVRDEGLDRQNGLRLAKRRPLPHVESEGAGLLVHAVDGTDEFGRSARLEIDRAEVGDEMKL